MRPRLLKKYVRTLPDGKYHRMVQYSFPTLALNHAVNYAVCGKGQRAIIYADRPIEWRDNKDFHVPVQVANFPRKHLICKNCLRMSKSCRHRYE